jgi:tetratricopeptide (TPR) repeat protein
MAWLLETQGDYRAAQLLYERVLQIREQALGPDHPATASSLHNLALLLAEQGDYAVAGPLYKRALLIREQALGPDHPDTAISRQGMAAIEQQVNNALAESADGG